MQPSTPPPSSDQPNDWHVSLGQEWDVLGPFPLHAREQHYLSPSFPLGQLTSPYLHQADLTWHSALADGGVVGWTKLSSKSGLLQLSFPDIRWKALRDTEGWSILQHHSVLRTRLLITPPAHASSVPSFILTLLGGSYIMFLPLTAPEEFIPEWHNGNIYSLANPPKQIVSLPVLSLSEPTIYDVFVSGDYEIRPFGDPRDVAGQETPILTIQLSLHVDWPSSPLVHEPSQDVLPDFIDGWAFGNALGVAFTSFNEWWRLKSVEIDIELAPSDQVTLFMPATRFRIAPHQTRVVPLRIDQRHAFQFPTLPLIFHFVSHSNEVSSEMTVQTVITLRQKSHWSNDLSMEISAFRATYFLGLTPAMFLAKPPLKPNMKSPTLIALHGAGVEISELPWEKSIQRMPSSWILLPSGRTSWGFDWRGPSSQDVWESFESFPSILTRRPEWNVWSTKNRHVVMIGHSNGGQGTWFHASRSPDRIVAAVPASGYLKSQLYVSLAHSHSAHFIDPSLQGILLSSLTPDDNDLFSSNLVNTAILAVHGGNDSNVPTWHSREYLALVKSWNEDANIALFEGKGKPHWYPDVLSSGPVIDFLKHVTGLSEGPSEDPSEGIKLLPSHFTMTVACPDDSGSMLGWKIQKLIIPGRLARLRVSYRIGGMLKVDTVNVQLVSFDPIDEYGKIISLIVDGDSVEMNHNKTVWFQRERGSKSWQVVEPSDTVLYPSGPICRILTSPSPLVFVVPRSSAHGLSIATRLVQNLSSYLRIDAEIITDEEAVALVRTRSLPNGNIVIIGTGSNNGFGKRVLDQIGPCQELRLAPSGIEFHGHMFSDSATGFLVLYPHPTCRTSLALFLIGTDELGLERAFRLFPLRTGVPLPDWVIVGKNADGTGASGILGAGFFDSEFGWNDPMSIFMV